MLSQLEKPCHGISLPEHCFHIYPVQSFLIPNISFLFLVASGLGAESQLAT